MTIITQPSVTRRGMRRTAFPALKGRAKVIRRYAAIRRYTAMAV
jgi:hypothetical protein